MTDVTKGLREEVFCKFDYKDFNIVLLEYNV